MAQEAATSWVLSRLAVQTVVKTCDTVVVARRTEIHNCFTQQELELRNPPQNSGRMLPQEATEVATWFCSTVSFIAVSRRHEQPLALVNGRLAICLHGRSLGNHRMILRTLGTSLISSDMSVRPNLQALASF